MRSVGSHPVYGSSRTHKHEYSSSSFVSQASARVEYASQWSRNSGSSRLLELRAEDEQSSSIGQASERFN